MNQDKPKSQLFRPAVAPAKRGGLILIGYEGTRMVIPDAEVEAFIKDMLAVRKKQVIEDCQRICQSVRFGGYL